EESAAVMILTKDIEMEFAAIGMFAVLIASIPLYEQETPVDNTAIEAEQVILDLDTILRTYREQNSMPDIQTHVRRRDIFRSVLNVMGKK
ncbi:unnamed protein product, partial [Coregonus sp. 'balchen']